MKQYILCPTRYSTAFKDMPETIKIYPSELDKSIIDVLGLNREVYYTSEVSEEYIAIRNHFDSLVCELFLKED